MYLTKCKLCEVEFPSANKCRMFCSKLCSSRDYNKRRVFKSEWVVSWRQRTKLKAVEYKGGKCGICGYSRCIRALKFHHLDSALKDFTVSGVSRSWERIKAELDKCILVCGNCHDEIHDGLVVVDVSSFVVQVVPSYP